MPSDESGLGKFPKLSDSNYGVWAMQMEAQLIRKGLFTDIVEIIVDTTTKEGDARPQEEIDKEVDKKMAGRSTTKMAEARAEMILCVEPGQLSHMRNKDPLVVWQDLKTVHRIRGFSAALSLCRKLLTMKKSNGQKMSGWIREVKAQTFEMEEAGVEVSELDTILAITMGLPSSYNHVVTTFDEIDTEQLTVDYVTTHLLNAETQQNLNPRAGSANTPDPNNLALQVTKVPTPIEQVTCYFCDAKGHYKSDCPKRKTWEASLTGQAGLVEDDDTSIIGSDDFTY